ncbi:UNVERIFIED_CONTAM: hypothetical protein PYX00_009451 [Menopon gallinae]|uniref:Ran-specific GTPase-activating protein n=1 Tax=Menopon gallinae TaxID=328185 RepID=A0AAW2HBI2_9NEOP
MFQDPCLKAKNEAGSGDENDEQENDPHFEPIISLPETEIPTLEEDEIVMVNLRARVYRYDSQENPPEWKERGTGNIKILHDKVKERVRVVMRRDKTLKLCANHFITPQMDLKPSTSCDRAWLYFVKADYIDESVKSHLLAVKFANIENAQKWKDAWDEAKKIVMSCSGKFICII